MNIAMSARAMRVASVVFIAFAAVRAAAAQEQPARAPGGTISGSVLDATTGVPLARATITLTSADGFGILSDPLGSSSLALARSTTSSPDGAYRFIGLPIGAYRLRFRRLGYEAASIEVRLGDDGSAPLSIGLAVLPVRLHPVEVRAHDADRSTDMQTSDADDDARLAAVRARQRAFLSTDTRELTSADVAESATLGGSDVFRSLQRLPGVTQLDDWSARLWVRGNRWDHDRVYFDGLPLFDPLGVLGRTAAIGADAIGGALLHPGVRPVTLGGDGATQIDLRSRPASGSGDWRGSTELSQLGASASIEHARDDGRAGILATAQHSLGEWPASTLFGDALRGRTYRDAQATFRGDVDLGDGVRIETSGLFMRDARTVRPAFDGDGTNQQWSNAASRLTFSAPVGALATSHTVGVSSYASNVDRSLSSASTPVTSRVDYLVFDGRIAPRAVGRSPMTVGYDLTLQRSSFTGTNESPVWGDPLRPFTSRRGALDFGSVWIDRRIALGERTTIETGARFDIGGAHALDAIRPAGSAQAAFALSPDTRVSVGASRVHQYLQAVELPRVGQDQTLPDSWLTSGGDVPVMTVDNAMAGLEKWVRSGLLFSANVYTRRTIGAVADDPTPGVMLHRPLFVDATESAHGAEMSARKLTGRVTGLIAYSYGHATMHARGFSFPAPADRPHALDAVTSVHLRGFSVSGAYTLTSGAPYTRTIAGLAASQASQTGSIPVRDAPDAQRLPPYSSLDLSLDYTRTFNRLSLIAFGGAQNVLRTRNVTWYEISGYCEAGQLQATAAPQCRNQDLVDAPVRFAPTIGLRALVR